MRQVWITSSLISSVAGCFCRHATFVHCAEKSHSGKRCTLADILRQTRGSFSACRYRKSRGLEITKHRRIFGVRKFQPEKGRSTMYELCARNGLRQRQATSCRVESIRMLQE